MKKCVFAGTFDPPTTGHEGVVLDSLKIFDEVVVAVLENTGKSCYFSTEERIGLLKKLFDGQSRVRVISFSGAAVDLLRREDTVFYVRGIRDGIDLDYENRNLYASLALMPDMVTIYLPARQTQTHVSSTLVRNSIHFNKQFREYIPSKIAEDVIKLSEEKQCSKNS